MHSQGAEEEKDEEEKDEEEKDEEEKTEEEKAEESTWGSSWLVYRTTRCTTHTP